MTYFTDIDDTAQADGFTLTIRLEPDQDHGAPWDEECGHGPVSDWATRDKEPGELILCRDRSMRRYYDYAEACRIARRDGWGFLPGPLETGILPATGEFFAHCKAANIMCRAADINEAVRAVYAAHRATYPSARAYAAAAARADFERLRAWCNDKWSYVGVIVTASRHGIELGTASLWGIESNASDYLLDVANELAEETIAVARAALETLTSPDEYDA